MKEKLKSFVLAHHFPCLMAKAIAKKGNLCVHEYKSLNEEVIRNILEKIYDFVDDFRKNPNLLSSFVVSFSDEKYLDFNVFEEEFWLLLDHLKELDRKKFSHDKRVASSPEDPRYSYSLKEEAFFILMLHPKSPRWSRRFSSPCLVFNPHRQFERLREEGKFKKIRELIRMRDKKLQGFINPMLKDYGEASEILQYTGRYYESAETLKERLKERGIDAYY